MSTNRSAESAEIEAILSSETFVKSPNLAKLLRYICQKHWEGRASDLKEYNIGVEALGRSPDFDPTTNSIVRVEAHRLREKLKKYYETQGASHPIAIALQVGHYVPQFIRRGEAMPEVPRHEVPASNGASAVSAGAPTGAVTDDSDLVAKHPSVSLSRDGSVFLGWGQEVATRRRLFLLLAAAVVILVLLAAWRLRPSRQSLAGATTPQPENSRNPATTPDADEVRILAGYLKDNYIDRCGRIWLQDRYFSQGIALTQPRQFIARTLDPTLFQTARSGEFSYNIPLKAGNYELRLYFMEGVYGPGTVAGGGETSRLFNVLVNGKTLLDTFDPFLDAGGNYIADERVFKDISPASDGYLHLRFTRAIDEPFVNAIEMIPGTLGHMRPIRIVAQENSYTDPAGLVWSPDRYFRGGRLAVHRGTVRGAADQDLYASERFGKFDYAIPVANGKYGVKLHFAETYFGTELTSGGVGSRVFDVYCNGLALLRNFDIFKEAGGANRALERTFHGLGPNAQGKLVLSFEPMKNYASVSAVEVVDESTH